MLPKKAGTPPRGRPRAQERQATASSTGTGRLVRVGMVVVLIGAGVLALTLRHRQDRMPTPQQTRGEATPAGSKSARGTASRERREYTGPAGSPLAGGAAGDTPAAIAAEALRDGPNGEPRIFENAQEQGELARGAPPKDLNRRFRYYLAGLGMTAADEGGCKQPLLALLLEVENLQNERVVAIRGKFTLSKSAAAGAGSMTAAAEPGGPSFHADIIGPFSNKHGGFVYATAQVAPADVSGDAAGLERLLAAGASKLKVWFAPEVVYYADGTQYTAAAGQRAAEREIRSCAGTEGGHRLFAQ